MNRQINLFFRVGIQLETAEYHFDSILVRKPIKGDFQPAFPDIAKRADKIGPNFDFHRICTSVHAPCRINNKKAKFLFPLIVADRSGGIQINGLGKGQRKSRTTFVWQWKTASSRHAATNTTEPKGIPFDAATEITDKPFIRDNYRRQGEKQTRTLLSEFMPRKKQGNCPAFFETFNFWGK
ncbi:hypothetical protein [Caldibacillus debilis]|uniref:hypothetical protein n=1 Tax=Caldibacillus debilis TaxID=301148 RepID=UPI001FD58885|nr:hypothetical protein [Caldibacillus debilis]